MLSTSLGGDGMMRQAIHDDPWTMPYSSTVHLDGCVSDSASSSGLRPHEKSLPKRSRGLSGAAHVYFGPRTGDWVLAEVWKGVTT